MNSNYYYLIMVLSILNIIFSIYYFNVLYLFISIVLFLIILFFNSRKKLLKKIYKLCIIIFLFLFLLETSNSFKKEVEESFINKTYNEVYNYAKSNKYKINTNYEYSDKIKENKIIFYSKENKNINVVVSSGVNYSKIIVVPNLIGKKDNYVGNYISKNYLNNVDINYKKSNECSDNTLIKQSVYGSIKRDDNISFTFCKKTTYVLKPIGDLTNMNKYKAVIKVLNKGYTYEIKYVFSNIVDKNNVIRTSIKNRKVILYVSKGKVLITPDFNKMNNNEIYNFIIKNNLNVTFKYIYDDKIKKDKFIKSNIKKYEKISSLDNIVLYFSKGRLTLPSFSKLDEFIYFAKSNNIKYKVKYEETNDVKENNIISFNIKPGSYITDKEIIVIVARKKKIVKKEIKEKEKEEVIYKRDISIIDMIE